MVTFVDDGRDMTAQVNIADEEDEPTQREQEQAFLAEGQHEMPLVSRSSAGSSPKGGVHTPAEQTDGLAPHTAVAAATEAHPDSKYCLETVVGVSAENGVHGFENKLVYSAASLVVVTDLASGGQHFWHLGDRVTALAFVEASFTESP